MSIPRQPDAAKLVVSLFMNNKEMVKDLLLRLEDHFGPLDIVSPWFDFDFTDYYHKEMGSPLFRRVAVFKPLIAQTSLAEIKEKTNRIEALTAEQGKRAVNIDPGYLLASRFILATGKDFSHRVYLDRGIYADLTLVYKKGEYRPLEWTYPDYAASEMTDFLKKVREKYLIDLKNEFSNPCEGEKEKGKK
ncbi:MAG: DUF4416 family protein [Desulfobacteraceae bacterium]